MSHIPETPSTPNCASTASRAWAIVLAAGSGTRLKGITPVSKQFLPVAGVPLYWHSVRTLARTQGIGGIVLVFPQAEAAAGARQSLELAEKENLSLSLQSTVGGARRQDSVRNGLACIPTDVPFVLVHDAARPFVSTDLVQRLLDALEKGAQAVIPGLPVTDTIKQVDAQGLVVATPPREQLRAVQTPQGFVREALFQAHQRFNTQEHTVTDDAALMEEAGYPVLIIEGEAANIKITNPEDLAALANLEPETQAQAQENPDKECTMAKQYLPCTGFGYDVHRYGGTRPLVLGGVPIETDLTIAAHSDGDVLLHALMDALLGLIGGGDIGELFPDTDPAWDGANSQDLLRTVLERVAEKQVRLTHADLTIIAQKPKIKSYKEAIRQSVADLLGLSPARVNVKATTEEGLGFTGNLEGIKACAVVSGVVAE